MPSDRYPAQNPRVAWRVYDGEAVLVSPDDSMLHTLNAVGTTIWEAADGRTSLDTIVERICVAFDVDQRTARHDADTFVEILRAKGLLAIHDHPHAE
jgi:hypothetical protein